MSKSNRLHYYLVAALLVTGGSQFASAQIQIEDTYTRDDNLTDLGLTEVGDYEYLKIGTTSGIVASDAEGIAEIYSNQLIVYGNAGFLGTGPGIAFFDDVNFADVTIEADMRFEGLGLFPITNPGSNNFGGFMLRRNGTTTGFTATNNGQVEVLLYPGGGLLIREIVNGTLTPLYAENPFGLGGSPNHFYSMAGQLPTSFNGMPFDANNNGVLEDDEPFRLGASLIGDALEITVNGLAVANVTTGATVPLLDQSFVGLYKNRATSATGLDQANLAFDNVVVTGTEWIPPPPPPILHVGDTNPVSEAWVASNAGMVANNGPINDNGTPAWNINDDSATGRAAWTRSLRPAQVDEALAEGWTMKGSVNVLGLDDVPDGGIEMSVYPNSHVGYTLWFGADSSGNPIVAEFGGNLAEAPFALGRSVTLDSTGFHDYEMVYDPDTQTVDVFANGALLIDDMLAATRQTTSPLNRILWGSNAGAGVGEANFSYVEFIIGEDSGGLVGDHNGDGVVNAADYVFGRDQLSGNFYNAFYQNFGRNDNSGAALADAVPEPSTLALISAALFATCISRARRKM